MHNVVGPIVSPPDFYRRDREIRRIKLNLEAGANIQISAPRRVGKSSILCYLLRHGDNYILPLYSGGGNDMNVKL